MLAGLTYVHTCHDLLLSSLQTLMSAMEQTHVHQMESVSIQMVPLHVTVPLAMSWISVDRAAQVSASRNVPVVSIPTQVCIILYIAIFL